MIAGRRGNKGVFNNNNSKGNINKNIKNDKKSDRGDSLGKCKCQYGLLPDFRKQNIKPGKRVDH